MTKINQDDITEDEIETAFDVLEAARSSFNADGLDDERATLNEAHYLVQLYENDYSEWESIKPSDRIDPDEYASLSDPHKEEADS